jgi:hypothetical protein
MDFPVPIRFPQSGLEARQFFAVGFSRESDDLLKYLHLAALIEK